WPERPEQRRRGGGAVPARRPVDHVAGLHAARPARAAHLALHAAAAGGAEGDAPPGARRSAPAVVAARAGLRAVAGAGRSVHRPAGTGPRLLAEPRRGAPAAAQPRPAAATAADHGP